MPAVRTFTEAPSRSKLVIRCSCPRAEDLTGVDHQVLTIAFKRPRIAGVSEARTWHIGPNCRDNVLEMIKAEAELKQD